jgi:hypothetical protein
MRWTKLTAFTALLFLFCFALNSCKPDELVKPPTTYLKTGIILSGAQQNPPNPSVATGILNVNYSKVTKTLTYDFTWSQLTGNPTGIGIYGLAPVGYSVFPPAPATAPIQTISTTGATAAGGSRSGSLLVDGVHVKEEHLLNELYYINIRTAAYPAGEIRAQIRFN